MYKKIITEDVLPGYTACRRCPRIRGHGKGRAAVRDSHSGASVTSEHTSGQGSSSLGDGDASPLRRIPRLQAPTAHKVRLGAVQPDPGRESCFGEGERARRARKTKNQSCSIPLRLPLSCLIFVLVSFVAWLPQRARDSSSLSVSRGTGGRRAPRPSPGPGRQENPERSIPGRGNALSARPLARMLSRAEPGSRKLGAAVAVAARGLEGGRGRTGWRAGALGRGCGSRPRFLGAFQAAKVCARSERAREPTRAVWAAGGAEPPGGAGSEPGSPRLGTRRRGRRCSTASLFGGATVMWRPSTSATARWCTSPRKSTAMPAAWRSCCWTPTSSASYPR